MRIRNHLIAQYFPEMDAYFGYGEGPAIVRWCLDPKEIAALPFEEFVRMVSSRNGGEKQQRRLREIPREGSLFYRLCKSTRPSPSRHRRSLEEVQTAPRPASGDGQEDTGGMHPVPRVSLSSDHPRVRTRHLRKGAWGHRQSPPIRESQTGAQDRQDSILNADRSGKRRMQPRSSRRRGRPISATVSIRQRSSPQQGTLTS